MVNGSLTYLHDANGNTTKDGLRDTNFTYNRLNLPRQVSKGGDELRYGYSADGRKREKKFNDVITRQYRGSIAYDGSGNPEYLLTPEGMARKVGNNWVRQYNLADHLGNTRAVLEPNGSVLQQADYYPFGTAFSVANLNKNKYLYGGKEYQDEVLGGTLVGLADFEARFMDSRIPRFTSMDPLREKYYDSSPYAYCSNNPVNRIDPDGRADFWLNGKVIGNDGIDDQKIYTIKTTEKDFNGVVGAGLSKKDQKATVDFIKKNSGNAEAFQNNGIAYTNSIGIESSADNRQAMVNEVNKDNGKGGTTEANNREYGGSIENGKVITATPGAVANPQTDATANILLPSGISTFHSHPSGTVVNTPSAGTIGGTTTTYSFTQSPSPMDINAAGTNTHYVFGRSAGVVYVYTANGIQAVIPMKQFVTPKR
jgi:RHS repeat-associated protein